MSAVFLDSDSAPKEEMRKEEKCTKYLAYSFLLISMYALSN
jgi:hypothetical protein